MINDLIISQIRQRLEILYQMVDELETGGGGGGGTTNYNDLTNKPSINNQVLTGNKTLGDLGAATPSDITQAFSPSTITLVEGGTFPSGSRSLLTEHKPINVNDDQYYFLEESGVDYLYGSMPTSGAYPSLSYLRIMKDSYSVEFHNTEIDTVPTEDSTNLITSGAVYDAVQGGGGGDVDLAPVNIGNKASTFPEQYRYLLQKRLPFKFTASYPYGSTWIGSWSVVSEDSTNYYCASLSPSGGSNPQSFYFANFSVNKSTWAWSAIRPNNLSDILVSAGSDAYFYGNSNIKTISGNSNLDSQFYGRYYCTAANAATATNCPTTDAFQLLVYNAMSSGSNEMIQQLTTVTAIPVVYRRTKIGTTWGSWYKFEGTVVS